MQGKVPTDNPPLLEFLEQRFINVKIANGTLSPGTAKNYRTTIVRLQQFAGRSLTCSEVTDDLLDAFHFWLREHGYKPKTIYSYLDHIRSVVRRWNPDHLARGHRHAGASCNFIEADVEGTLEEVCLKRYLPQNPKTASSKSMRMYGLALRFLGQFLERPAMLADLNDETVAAYLRWLVDVRGNKPITANGYVKRIRALWSWCAKKRFVAEFPTIALLPVAESIPIGWSTDELRQLLLACQKQAGHIGRIKAAAFWTAYHYVLFDAGERAGAVLALRWEWLNWRTGHLEVPAEVRKGGRKPRLYRLKRQTIDKLRTIRSPSREIIFELPFQPTTFYHHYKKLVESAGLKYVKSKSGPQKMRRTFASFIEAAGGNATRALGHTDRRVTEQSYLDPRLCDLHDENEKLFSLDALVGVA